MNAFYLFLKIIFWLSVFNIFWANIGYPLSILLLGKIIKRKNISLQDYVPTVTLMIVAHNEEKVIKEKLENVLKIDYPKNKLEILVSSDNSTDKTNEIVKNFIKNNKKNNIRLYEVNERKGKTNAQNEAARTVKSEILVMTDANAMLEENVVKELVSSFDTNVAYVTGKLVYSNSGDNLTSSTESTYWDLDTRVREIESNIQTITAGNGAIYACKTEDYHAFNPIQCHDSAMPLYYSLQGKRAIANHNAIAYEKAGENDGDEFKRKIRMSRIILGAILPTIKILNIFKYKWFTFFYLGHRTSRYLLWLSHITLLLLNIFLLKINIIYVIVFVLQIVIYILALLKNIFKINNKIFNFCSYYCMTIIAQTIGVFKTITGQNKPFWEKAESTR